jgi:hypothetical protein
MMPRRFKGKSGMLMDPFNQNPTEIFASQKREKE